MKKRFFIGLGTVIIGLMVFLPEGVPHFLLIIAAAIGGILIWEGMNLPKPPP